GSCWRCPDTARRALRHGCRCGRAAGRRCGRDSAGRRSGCSGTRASGRRSNRTCRDSVPFCYVTLRRVRCLMGPYLTERKGYPTSPKTVGEMIRKRRLDLGLLQREAAAQIGCDTDTVTNWEKGRSTPDLKHVAKIVEF